MSIELRSEEVWQEDGHVTEVALTALGDGEIDLVPSAARAHVDECDHCGQRLGALALLAVSLDEALAAPAVVEVTAPAPEQTLAPPPAWALVLGLVAALVGALPTLLEVPAWLAGLPATLTRVAPIALRVAASLFKVASTGNTSLLVLSTVATVVLTAAGLMVARLAPRTANAKGISQ